MFICIFTFASKGSIRDTQFTDWILGEELRNEYDFIQTKMIHIRLLFLKYLFHIPPLVVRTTMCITPLFVGW